MSNRPSRQKSSRPTRGRPSSAEPKRSQLPWLIGGGIIVVIALVVGLAFAFGGDDGDSSSAQDETGFAEIIGQPLPRYDSGAPADPAVDTEAPTIRGTTIDGEQITVDPADGTPRVIGFFAHWCPHCQRELPRLTSWIADNGVPDGVELVAVSTAVDSGQPNYPPSAWFEREGWTEVVVRDNDAGALATGYGLPSFPYFVVTDGDGQVVVRTSGELTTEQWEALVSMAEASASV